MGIEGRRPRLLDTDPAELLVYDEIGPCPYLPTMQARLPMRLPVRPLERHELGERLRQGDRRQGLLLYRPACPSCQACTAIRLDAREFVGSRSQRRVLKSTGQRVTVELANVSRDPEKVRLYNAHKVGRALLADDSDAIDASGYEAFLVDSCTETFEMRYRLGDRLVGVAVVDRSDDGLSAVYTYYDPDVQRLGLGTFSIMKQVELCRTWGLVYLYLGLHVRGCATMAYKARFVPHERLEHGTWVRVERDPDSP